ncbi:MAG: dUTP diphosphatase [Sneathiella sp.]|nr:dUTP diphosphatase [Sneathiella sp.]
MSSVPVQITRLPHAADLPLPRYETEGSAGMDVVAAVDAPVTIPAGARALIPTGFKVAIPQGYEIQVRPRSGLALKKGISLPNTPGTIDADYRGEVGIILINHGEEAFEVARGDRIAQLVLAPVTIATWVEVDQLSETARGEGGFGSTGVAAVKG